MEKACLMGYMSNKVRFKGMEVLADRYNGRLSVRPVASALPRRYILNICLVNCRMTCFFSTKKYFSIKYNYL